MSQSVQEKIAPKPVPVHCRYGKGSVFLEVVRQGNRVRVQRTRLGQYTLQNFWISWLAELIRSKTNCSVELTNDRLVVFGEMTPQGLLETVRSLAAEIYPMMDLPLVRMDKRNNRGTHTNGPIQWYIKRSDLPVTLTIQSIQLPRGASLELADYPTGGLREIDAANGYLRLTYKGTSIPGSEIALLVEQKFARAFCPPPKRRN